MSEEELAPEHADAAERGRIADQTEPRAVSARYDRETGRMLVELRNGCLFAFPTELVQDLRGALPEQLAAVQVIANGLALQWDELDASHGVPALLQGRFGGAKWLARWGGSGWNAPASPVPAEMKRPEPVRRRKAS